jgi:glyoxalase-like protein
LARGLDHIVHAVRDLDAAGAHYQSLGFTVGARNKHSWGTHNRIVQFPGVFIELLTLAEPGKLGHDGFSKLFGAYTGEFLKRGEGLSLLILESRDARADESDFRAAGIAASDVMRFDREGSRPDGTPVKVGFSLAFAEDKHAPDIHFAICQQHYPENFWNPAFQKHPNGVTGIAGVVLVAPEPATHVAFMQNFGSVMPKQTSEGFSLTTPRGAIEVMTPVVFSHRFGLPAPDTSRGARLAAIRFSGGKPQVNAAMGAVLAFE